MDDTRSTDAVIPLENAMNYSAQKTPISLLQELCAQHGITPDYKLMSVEGAVHAPTFMYRVQVSEVIATATGQSKKKAKHAAAKAVLEKLVTEPGPFGDGGFVSDGVTIDANSLSGITVEPSQQTSQDDGIAGNPVGSLQELCMKQRWQPPFYETELEEGLPHERVFHIACYVDCFNEIGKGKSKRLAKRQAADKMLKRLEALKNDSKDDVKEEAKLNGITVADAKEGVKDLRQSNLQAAYSQHVLKFLKELKTSNSLRLLALKDDASLTDGNCNYVELLQEISEEQEFELAYIPIEEQGRSGNFQCLLQIASLPVAVCFGSGKTREEAKFDVAHNALQFLKIMSKK